MRYSKTDTFTTHATDLYISAYGVTTCTDFLKTFCHSCPSSGGGGELISQCRFINDRILQPVSTTPTLLFRIYFVKYRFRLKNKSPITDTPLHM